MSLTNRQQDYVDALTRRQLRLVARLKTYVGNDSHVRAEIAAITWVLAVVDNADKEGVLDDLDPKVVRRNRAREETT